MKKLKSIQEQVQKDLPDFAAEVAALSVGGLNERLTQCAKDYEANEDAKESDEELEQAQAKASELGAPYRDCRKMIRMKSRYLISLIRERGGKV